MFTLLSVAYCYATIFNVMHAYYCSSCSDIWTWESYVYSFGKKFN